MSLLNPFSIGRQMSSLMASLVKGSRRRSPRHSFSIAPAMIEVLESRILMTHGDLDDQISEAVPVLLSQSVSGQIDVVTDVDMYAFQKPANVDVVISVESDTWGFSPLLRVFQQEAGGSIVQINNPSVNPGDFELPLSAGTYWIGVSELANEFYSPVSGSPDLVAPSSSTGYYTLSVTSSGGSNSDDHGNTPSTATPIDTPSTTDGNLEVAGDNDYFRFTAVSGSTYSFMTSLGSLTDSTLRLYDTDGQTQLAYNDDGLNVGLASRIDDWIAPTSGTYYLEVQGYNNTRSGTYDLDVTSSGDNNSNNSFETATDLGLQWLNESLSIPTTTLTDALDADYYILTAGSSGTLDVLVGSRDCTVTIYASDQSPISDPSETSASINSTTASVTAGETYFVVVTAASGASAPLTYDFSTLLQTGSVEPADNTAPELDNSGTPYLIAPVGSRLPVDMSNGILIADLLARGAGGNPVTDADSGALEGIALTGINKIDGVYGTWEYTLVDNPQATDWIDVETDGDISNFSALLLPAYARLRFVTTLVPYHGSSASAGHLPTETKLDTGLMFRAWDQTTGTAGERADTSINGGSTAFSNATETAGTYFETRLWRTYNATALLNTYSLELEATILINNFGYQDRSTSDYSGFTILMSPIPGVTTAPLFRMYFGIAFDSPSPGIQTDMGYRYLTTNPNEVTTIEGNGPPSHRADRDGAYFREPGVNGGTGITGYVYTTAQPGTTEMSQIYRTDLFRKNTRTGAPGTPATGTVMQQQGDHVYTTKSAFEMSKPGTWRQESSRGFVRELSPNVGGVAAPARSAAAQTFSIGDQQSASTISADFAEIPRRLTGLLEQSGLQLSLSGPTNTVFVASVEGTASSESPEMDSFDSLTAQNDEEQSSSSELVWSAFGRQFSDFFASCP
jgi:hypothetical protein